MLTNEQKNRLKQIRNDVKQNGASQFVSCFDINTEKDEITRGWNVIDSKGIKLIMSDNIRTQLEKYYKPLNQWRLKNDDNGYERWGCYDENGVWMRINTLETNYSGHTLVFNEINRLLYKIYKETGKEYIIYDGITFSCINPITFNNNWNLNYEETVKNIKLQLKLSEYFFNDLFIPGTDFYYQLKKSLMKTYNFGEECEKFYVNHIDEFFPDIIDYTISEGLGDARDIITGIDMWTKHKNTNIKSHQIKGSSIRKTEDGYYLRCAFNINSRCDYYVFVNLNNQIVVFNYNKNLVSLDSNGVVFFPNELLHLDKLY